MNAFRWKLLLIAFLLAFAVPSFGATIEISFYLNLPQSGGDVSIAPAGTDAWGSGIFIDSLQILANGTYTYYPVTSDTWNDTGSLDFGGGQIMIEGGIAPLNIPPDTILLMGTIGKPAVSIGGEDCDMVAEIAFHGSVDINTTLLTDLGLPTNAGFSLGGSVFASPEPPSCYFDPNTGGDVTAWESWVSTDMTPEPVSMVLMGSFLTMAGGLLSWRKRM